MGVGQHAVDEMAADNRRQQHGRRPFRTRFVHIAPQVFGILRRRRIARRIIDFLVVVTELDEYVIARAQPVADARPPPLGAERLGRTAVGGVVLDDYRFVEQRLEHVAPPAFGVLLVELLGGARRIADEVDAQRIGHGFRRSGALHRAGK